MKTAINGKRTTKPRPALYSGIDSHSWPTRMERTRLISGKPDLKLKAVEKQTGQRFLLNIGVQRLSNKSVAVHFVGKRRKKKFILQKKLCEQDLLLSGLSKGSCQGWGRCKVGFGKSGEKGEVFRLLLLLPMLNIVALSAFQASRKIQDQE